MPANYEIPSNTIDPKSRLSTSSHYRNTLQITIWQVIAFLIHIYIYIYIYKLKSKGDLFLTWSYVTNKAEHKFQEVLPEYVLHYDAQIGFRDPDLGGAIFVIYISINFDCEYWKRWKYNPIYFANIISQSIALTHQSEIQGHNKIFDTKDVALELVVNF